MHTRYSEWPEWVESSYGKIEPARVSANELHVTHINHATVLVQVGGYNIITDPIFSERCSPISWAGPKRVRNPGVRFEDLPPVDIVLISHDHYDHLDLPTLDKLIRRDHPKIFVGLGVGRHLSSMENVTELDWRESNAPRENLKIHFVPVQHFSGRTLFDRDETLWGGYVVEAAGRRIYFGGDTGYGPHFKLTRQKYGPMDLALLPIGAYEPHDFMGYSHLNPEEALQAHLDLETKRSIGIHYGTFQLTAEPYDEPIRKLNEALLKRNIARAQFLTPDFGKVLKL